MIYSLLGLIFLGWGGTLPKQSGRSPSAPDLISAKRIKRTVPPDQRTVPLIRVQFVPNSLNTL